MILEYTAEQAEKDMTKLENEISKTTEQDKIVYYKESFR